jgi:uncharacterized protein involved in type VI secretion and phage assembly
MDAADLVRKILTFGLEYFGKYYSLYQGIVVSNTDSQGQGRIKVKVPALGRDEELAEYAYPVSPFAGNNQGFFFPPEVGSYVWIAFEGGNPGLPLYMGGWWTNPSKTASGATVPVEANTRGESPTVRGIKTKSGHRIIFDDGSPGGITIQTPGGVIVNLNDADNQLNITAPTEILIKTQTAKVQATSASVSASMVSVTANTASITGSVLRLNNGTQPVARLGDSVTGGHSISSGNPTILG